MSDSAPSKTCISNPLETEAKQLNQTTTSPLIPGPNSNSNSNSNNGNDQEDNETHTKTTWQSLMDRGRTHLARRELERARQVFTSALHLCDRHPAILTPHHHRYRTLGDLGWVERLCGRYEVALGLLGEACVLADSAPSYSHKESGDGEVGGVNEGREEREGESEKESRPRVFIAGEIGTVYRQMGRLEEAKEAFESQLAIAQRLGMDGPACRARGNLGAVVYQLALSKWEAAEGDHRGIEVKKEVEDMVAAAMDHLQQGMELASKIYTEESKHRGHGPSTREREARGWEAMGYGRLALCYSLLADLNAEDEKDLLEKAADAGEKAVESARWSHYSSVLPLTQYFYGHVLLRQGHKELALDQFKPAWGGRAIAPVTAMCKEPSAEHRRYLAEMIEAGTDLDVLDRDGYSALDHAVFSGDAESERMVLDGLRTQLGLSEREAAARQTEAHLRKGYREILQEKLRPILYWRDEDPDCVKKLRKAYAEALAADPDKSRFFDHLKFIRYSDFKRFGRLPRSSDGLVRAYEDGSDVDALVFFSYRWINQDRSLNTPDDAHHTQYRRMLDAAELYLQQNPSVDEAKLCIWMDFACVDQDNPDTGVSALPIIVIQCDAVISLVDDAYYERAWCCVEAMMIAQLRHAIFESNSYAWYEHRPLDGGEAGEGASTREWTLEAAPRVRLDMKDKKLTYETDRPKVMFLERQSQLLGRVDSLGFGDSRGEMWWAEPWSLGR